MEGQSAAPLFEGDFTWMSSCVCSTAHLWSEPWREARLGFFPLFHSRVPQNFTRRSIAAVTWWKLPVVPTVSVVGLKGVVSVANFVISSFHSSEERCWVRVGRICCAGWSVENCRVEGDNGILWPCDGEEEKTKLCKPSTLGFQLWGMDLAPCLIATEINSNPVVMLVEKKVSLLLLIFSGGDYHIS